MKTQTSELRKRRLALDLRQRELAERLGCSIMAISYAERGQRAPRIARKLVRLLRKLESEQQS